MGISLYCSMTHVHFVEGVPNGKKIKVTGYQSYPIPEGTVINGMIIEEEPLISVLKTVCEERNVKGPPVSLVVDSSNIAMRMLTAPLVKEREVMAFVQRELSFYHEEDADTVYDYAVLKPRLQGGGGSILGVAVERSFLNAYKQVFDAAGCKLSGIDIGLNCQIKLALAMDELSDEMHVLAMVDGNNLILTLFDGTEYVLANRYRLLHTFLQAGWYGEFSDTVSSLIQFNKGQKNRDITAVYVDGVPEAALREMEESLSRANVKMRPIPCEGAVELAETAERENEAFQLGKYMYNVGNLLKK